MKHRKDTGPGSIAAEVPGGGTQVLLHICCAPCASAIVDCLVQGGVEPVLFYSNSNIYPREEYEHRRDECARYARHWGIRMVEDEYDHESWRAAVQGLEDEPERGKRCQACFRYRLGRAAAYGSIACADGLILLILMESGTLHEALACLLPMLLLMLPGGENA